MRYTRRTKCGESPPVLNRLPHAPGARLFPARPQAILDGRRSLPPTAAASAEDVAQDTPARGSIGPETMADFESRI